MTVTPPLYYLGNARHSDQRDKIVRLEETAMCMFCPEHWNQPDGAVVYWENETWALASNDFPYSGTELHLLLLPREHATMLTELSPASRLGFFEALDYVQEAYGLSYYGLASRNGDMRYSGATIAHLHVHIVVGAPDNPGPAVAVYLSSVPSPDPSPA
jgi:ATP adenylyltransferase